MFHFSAVFRLWCHKIHMQINCHLDSSPIHRCRIFVLDLKQKSFWNFILKQFLVCLIQVWILHVQTVFRSLICVINQSQNQMNKASPWPVWQPNWRTWGSFQGHCSMNGYAICPFRYCLRRMMAYTMTRHLQCILSWTCFTPSCGWEHLNSNFLLHLLDTASAHCKFGYPPH